MIKTLVVNLIVSLGVGGLSAFLTRNSMDIYSKIIVPPFAPPSSVFPVVWSILYVLMAISATLIYEKTKNIKSLAIYGIQLVFNLIWPLLFFNAQMFLLSFIWLMILWAMVLVMIIQFYKIKPIAAYLQIPYFIWLTFAAILNWSIYFLNR